MVNNEKSKIKSMVACFFLLVWVVATFTGIWVVEYESQLGDTAVFAFLIAAVIYLFT